jgi:hypothetical protein
MECKIQNTQVLVQNAKIFMGVFSSIQNAKFFLVLVGVGTGSQTLLGCFFCLLRPKSKIENSYLFAKNFAWCLVPLMMDQNLEFFGMKGEVNTP